MNQCFKQCCVYPDDLYWLLINHYNFFSTFLGGAGGKGTWGKAGEVYDDTELMNDEQDPNYDSEEAEVVCWLCIVMSFNC